MKRLGCLVLLCALLGVVCGCHAVSTEETAQPIVELSSEELRLFRQIYTDIERIEEGKLFDYQLEALNQLRAGVLYMEEKYPSYTFSYSLFEPATKMAGYATLVVAGSGDTVRIRPTADGEGYTCNDNFYEALIQNDYAVYMEALLGDCGIHSKTYTRFPELLGDELAESATLDDYLLSHPKLTRDTDLFVSADDFKQLDISILEADLRHNGVYGSFTVYQVPDITLDINELEGVRRDFPYICFNCF